jgi:uncharacterized protein (DUF2141 family)
MKLRIFLLMIIVLLAGLYQAAAQGFVLSSSPGVGNFPYSIAAADVNGDGKLDLICADYLANTLTVLTNNGNGNFGSNATYTVGINPTSVTAADVNGDGRVDLICANSGTNTLTVLTNNGSGGFVLSANIAGAGSYFVTAADVNGDGKLDLICENSTNTLAVLTNNGSGGFALSGIYTVGYAPASVAAADVNGDGKPDLICANNLLGNTVGSTLPGNTLTVLTNNGNGVFGSNATYVVGSGLFCVIAADINGDGMLDLITANNGTFGSDTTFTVLTNNGSGSFGSNATYIVGSAPCCVVAADVNGDGKLDLIIAGTGSSTLTVLTNDGNGGFVTAFSPAIGSGSFSVVAADVNGDGKLDLISANAHANTLTVLTNALTFPPPTSTPLLTIKQSGNNVRVSWPSASAGWSLQQNPNLTTTHWGPSGYSGYPISDDSTNKSLFIPSQPGNLFFRLLHP